MTFCFYAEPQTVLTDRQAHNAIVGLGEDRGVPLAHINVGDGYRNDGDVLLTGVELTRLIDHLVEVRNAMEAS